MLMALIGALNESLSGVIFLHTLTPRYHRALIILILFAYQFLYITTLQHYWSFWPFYVFYIIYLTVCYKDSPKRLLMSLALSQGLGLFLSQILKIVYMLVFNSNMIISQSKYDASKNMSLIQGEIKPYFAAMIVILPIFYALFIPMALWVIRVWKKKIETNQNYIILMILFFFSQALFISSTGSMIQAYFEVRGEIAAVTTMIVANIMALLLNIALLYFADRSEKRIQLEYQLKQMQQQQEMQVEKLNQFTINRMELKKFNHDIHNQLHALHTLMLTEKSEAESFLHSLLNKNSELEEKNYSQNPVVDAIVQYKMSQAISNGIHLQVEIALPASLSIAHTDLCSIFSNLLDNAIEACLKIPTQASRQIELFASIKKKCLYVKTINTSHKTESGLRTTKANAELHGIGLQIVKEIAEKYDGTVDFKADNDQFISVVVLNLQDGVQVC